ncbi:hypothetical protein PGB90_008940 [Kerria lacca]
MNTVKKGRNQSNLSSSGLKLPSNSSLAKEIEILNAKETEENPISRVPDVEIARRETRVLYKRNSNGGSNGSIHEEIRIYDNPFTSYYPVNGQENEILRPFKGKRNVTFYLKDAFCPIRQSRPNLCLTEECVKTAAFLLRGMNQNVDPCEDFFEYACGTWNKIHVIPEDRSSITTFEVLADQLQHILRRLLDEPINSGDNDATIKAKIVYKSCVNLTDIKLNGEFQMKKLVKSFGGWPVADNMWSETNIISLEKLFGQMKRQLNDGIVMELWVGPDDKNSSVHVIQIDQLILGLPGRDYFLHSSDGILNAYHEYMTAVAILFGANKSEASVEMQKVIDFEIRLASITIPEAQRQDTSKMYSKLTLRQLKKRIPHIAWDEYFNNVLLTQLEEEESIVLYSLSYFIELGKLLMNTNRRVVQNYAIWKLLLNNLLPHMTDTYQQIRLAFKKVLYGISSERNRWSQCVDWTNKKLGMAVGALFIRENFSTESKESAIEMIQNIREAFHELLDENKWMDDETKQLAKEKANAINERIGYPDILTKSSELEIEYQKLNVSQNHFFLNLFNLLSFECMQNMEKLRKPVDKDRWTTEPAIVNAFYNPNKNDIVFPAGILQPFFYSEYFPKSVNYGGIGVVIGHEMTHGFDDKGRQFDKNGNMKEWWNNVTISCFKKQIQCIIDQYSSYKIEEIGMNLNGLITQGENIADNGGLKQAFRAYQKYVKRYGEEPLLPGLNLTHEQLFFLNYAQIWCGSMRPEDALSKIRSSSHSPGRIRVIGPLSNSYDFAKAFQCKSGSKMNPKQKCVVW